MWRRDEHLHRAGSATTPGDGRGPPEIGLWLVYRTFALGAPLRLTWRQLYRQFDRADPGLAGVEPHDGSGTPDPASLDTGYRPPLNQVQPRR